MRTMERRLRRLEQRMGANPQEMMPAVLVRAESFKPDIDRCVEILRQCGYVQTGQALLNLVYIPAAVRTAEEFERYVREYPLEVCGGYGWSEVGTGEPRESSGRADGRRTIVDVMRSMRQQARTVDCQRSD